jgi:hypothetical protein
MPSPEGAQIIQFDLPHWTCRIRAKAGSEKAVIIDNKLIRLDLEFPKRIPLQINLV